MILAVGRNVRPALEELIDPCLVVVRVASDVEVLYRPNFITGWLSGSSRGSTPSGVFIFLHFLLIVYMVQCACLILYFVCLLCIVLPRPVVSRVDVVQRTIYHTL